jgi:peptidoglycan/xylan/chitin deacetylase (PgdA/CDA1 family)
MRAQTVCFVLAGGIVVASGAVLWTAPEWLIQNLARWYPGCLYQMPMEERLVALTIDDGPDPASTPLILTELRRQDARATFFLITDRLRGQEPLVRRLVGEGHEIGNHFTQDRPSIRLSLPAFEADLLQSHRELAPWGRPHWARPGSGWYSQAMISVLQRHGYRCVLGSVYPFDATDELRPAECPARCHRGPARWREPRTAYRPRAGRGLARVAPARLPGGLTERASS